MIRVKRTQRSEEPTVLAAGVAVLKGLLDVLLGVLAGGNLLEGLGGDGTLKTLELESVASGHQVVVVDDLDERLDAAALLDGLLTHATGDLEGVALDTGDDGVREGVRLGASVVRLDNDDLSFAKETLVSTSILAHSVRYIPHGSSPVNRIFRSMISFPCKSKTHFFFFQVGKNHSFQSIPPRGIYICMSSPENGEIGCRTFLPA